jgi:pantoate--beta-alanine ligase
MEIFKTKTELSTYLNTFYSEKSVGFTPTMGALHSGHLQLIESSKIECDITICSVFVNPTQFNNSSDLEKYPNTLKSDLEKLKKVNCDIVYAPSIDDLYAKGEKAKEFNFGSLAASMEGKFRSGHFNGMATIVEKFFNIINPTKAFFGQKDLQQLQIVKALVKQMHSDIEIIGIPIIRDESGLAKSSRNSLLSANAKTEALLISKCLNFCTENKRLGISELQKYIKSAFEKSRNLELEYAEFVSLKQMKEIKEWETENQSAVCIAAYIDGVRLIDNIIL